VFFRKEDKGMKGLNVSKLAIWVVIALGLACAAPREKVSTPSAVAEKSAASAAEKGKEKVATAEGLVLTRNGIDFKGHACSGSYFSKSSDMQYDDNDRLIGYKIVTTCSGTGEKHTYIYSDIVYNPANQRVSYQLEMSCSRTGERYVLKVDKIVYDEYWEPLSYQVEVNGKTYYFKR